MMLLLRVVVGLIRNVRPVKAKNCFESTYMSKTKLLNAANVISFVKANTSMSLSGIKLTKSGTKGYRYARWNNLNGFFAMFVIIRCRHRLAIHMFSRVQTIARSY